MKKNCSCTVHVRKYLSHSCSPEPLDQHITFTCTTLFTYWLEMKLLVRDIKQSKTSTLFAATKTRACQCGRSWKYYTFFISILSIFFFSLPCCLVHSLWPIFNLILTSSRETFFPLGTLHSDYFFFNQISCYK